jgi:DNA-binding GntR family transcriptional regulator
MRAMEASYMDEEEAQEHPAHGEMVAHIVEKLRHDILDHRFAPGSRLVENDLTHRFHVSRGPIREALRRLAAEGLIEHLPNRGALVRKLSREEIRELFEIRIELEALAARLAANVDDEAERRKFSAAIAPIYDSDARAAPGYLEENTAFHSAIMELAGNRQLHELALRLQLPLLMAQVGDILSKSVLDDSVREHRELATAILTHDANAADAALRAHLGRAAKLALARAID